MAIRSSTDFPSIVAFLEYFKNANTLEIPAKQPLFVRNIQALESPYFKEADFLIPNIYERVSFHLNRIISPLGKRIQIKVRDKDPDYFFKVEKDLLAIFYKHITLEVCEAETLPFRFSELFRMMTLASIPEVVFPPSTAAGYSRFVANRGEGPFPRCQCAAFECRPTPYPRGI